MMNFENAEMQNQAERLNIEPIYQEWQSVTLDDVVAQMQQLSSIDPTSNTSRAYIIEPQGEIDETRSLVLALPHLQGMTPQAYIKAKFMHDVLMPNSRMVILPNNDKNQTNYDIEAIKAEADKNSSNQVIEVFGEQQMRTLERVQDTYGALGTVDMTGYGLGGSTVITMASAGSEKIKIGAVNADEAAQQTMFNTRSEAQLNKDISASGSSSDIRKAVEESDIPAMRDAMSIRLLGKDFIKMMLKANPKDAKILGDAMREPLGNPVFRADKNSDSLKLGFVHGSKVFTNKWRVEPRATVERKQYIGREFHGHATGENAILQTLMAGHGLKIS